MLAHDWESLWLRLEPELIAFNAAVCRRHPRLTGHVERHTYGEAYFSAMAYLMVDPVRDEHELAILELRVVSTVRAGDGPPSLAFDPADPAAVDLEVSVRGVGRIVHSERPIPANSSSAEIDHITSGFVDEVIIDLPSLARQVVTALDERPEASK